ncbi:MAG: ABC-type amino acid transport/signal transduction system, periplasmic component/domain [Rhodospirillales bacterium]|nr:ABC-type amino acid transport/signal transduction system, periplasmic component/domain [Rhodospirillales bacterium]
MVRSCGAWRTRRFSHKSFADKVLSYLVCYYASRGTVVFERWTELMALRRLVLLLAGIVAACLASAAARAAETPALALVYDTNENPPFTYGVGTDTDPKKPGFVIELIRAAAAHAGVPVSFNRVPWARGLEMVETHEADGIFMASYTEDRLRYGVYPMNDGKPDAARKLTDLSYWLYTRRDSGVGWDGKTITNLHTPIAATTGYAVVPLLEKMSQKVVTDPNHLRNLHKLESGDLDAYAELQAHVDGLIRAYPKQFRTIVKLEPPIRTTAYYLMVSKTFYAARPADAERLWDAIAWVNAQPEFQDMVEAKYTE